MIRIINTTALMYLSLAIGLGSCKNDKKQKEIGQLTFDPIDTAREKWNDTKKFKYIYQNNSADQKANQNKNNYKVHGIDEDGNEFIGSVNIEGEVGIGIINGIEALINNCLASLYNTRLQNKYKTIN
jgi:hypothetical protein